MMSFALRQRLSPAKRAIVGADLAVIAGLSLPSGHMTFCSRDFSAGVNSTAPTFSSAAIIVS